jgi:hypothetical protein
MMLLDPSKLLSYRAGAVQDFELRWHQLKIC